jgi:hypothetical protein
MQREFVVYEKIPCFVCKGDNFSGSVCYQCTGKGYDLREVDLRDALAAVNGKSVDLRPQASCSAQAS